MKARFLKRLVALGLLAGSSAALACADSGCYPSWKLFAGGTGCEDRGFLAPGNDTRVNLLFLLRDRAGPASSAGLSYPKGGYDTEGFGSVFLDPYMQRAAFYPDPAGENAEPAPYIGYRCAGYDAGTQALAAAMQANRGLPAGDTPEPRANFAVLAIRPRPVPGGQERLLQHILDGGRGQKPAQTHREPRRVPLVQRAQGTLVPRDDRRQQRVVGALVFDRWVRGHLRHLIPLWRWRAERFHAV